MTPYIVLGVVCLLSLAWMVWLDVNRPPPTLINLLTDTTPPTTKEIGDKHE